jgi:hypothetical protein
MLGQSAVGHVAMAALPTQTQGLTTQLFIGVTMAAVIRAQRVLEVILMLSPALFALVG